jgi:hypothetical protein
MDIEMWKQHTVTDTQLDTNLMKSEKTKPQFETLYNFLLFS